MEDHHMTGAEMTLARYLARQAVKPEMYAQGIKLAHVESCEISRAAINYLDNHPELFEWAAQRYRQLVESGQLRPRGEGNLFNTYKICTKTKALIGKGFRCANVMCVIAAHVRPCGAHDRQSRGGSQ
jgi:hypothetical protein